MTDAADAPPLSENLAAILAAATIAAGQSVMSAYAQGMREGMECAAQVCDANIVYLAAEINLAAASVAQAMRDQIRTGALCIETPVYNIPGAPS